MIEKPKRGFWWTAGIALLWAAGILIAVVVLFSVEKPGQLALIACGAMAFSYFYNNWERDRAHTRHMLDQQAKEIRALQQVLADVQFRLKRLDRDRGADPFR